MGPPVLLEDMEGLDEDAAWLAEAYVDEDEGCLICAEIVDRHTLTPLELHLRDCAEERHCVGCRRCVTETGRLCRECHRCPDCAGGHCEDQVTHWDRALRVERAETFEAHDWYDAALELHLAGCAEEHCFGCSACALDLLGLLCTQCQRCPACSLHHRCESAQGHDWLGGRQ